MISYIVQIFFSTIYLIILIVVLCSWIPVLNLRKEPLASIKRIYDSIMAPFKFIPPIGMIDISPLVAFIVLQLLENIILRLLAQLGL